MAGYNNFIGYGYPSNMNYAYGAQPSAPDPMAQLRANPLEVVRRAGYNVPDNLAGNPQAMVMHLIQSGQINSPMLQRIRPFLAQMNG